MQFVKTWNTTSEKMKFNIIGNVYCIYLRMALYINDLNQAKKFCKVHHFADDINLLCLSNLSQKTEQGSQCLLKQSNLLVKCK